MQRLAKMAAISIHEMAKAISNLFLCAARGGNQGRKNDNGKDDYRVEASQMIHL